ncbi:DNA-binding protein [Galactobacter caseinivorans]|uniref:DNA-binding protein n=2 Tax=Galactobacter caseinivorans TaxID=2676123 RepID=A0A496PIH2_9MICC|nr:DNA-binding protein [Galactobacter caseinivorans]
MRLEDVAEELDFSPAATRKLLNDGDLKGIKVGGRGIWRVERSEFEAYIQRLYVATQRSIEAESAPELKKQDQEQEQDQER